MNFKQIKDSARGLVEGRTRSVSEWYSDFREDVREGDWYLKLLYVVVPVLLVVSLVFGALWSREPDLMSVVERTHSLSEQYNQDVVVGSHTTVMLIEVMSTLLDKRGGFITNDMFPPGVWLDNMPAWEYGALIQSRDLAKAMREAFSRSQSQSAEDKDLALAESRFNFNNASWAVPASESEYREGIEYVEKYLMRLGDQQNPQAQFYARADNLRYWLGTVETRLGSLSQRLSASVGQRRLNTDLAGDPSASQATSAPRDQVVKTPWHKIDDVFYEARGASWALIHFLRAVERDFADVLEKKNARVSLRQIIRELEATQESIYSPLILNGSGFGMLANHSLVMASYISRANAALIDLRDLMARG